MPGVPDSNLMRECLDKDASAVMDLLHREAVPIIPNPFVDIVPLPEALGATDAPQMLDVCSDDDDSCTPMVVYQSDFTTFQSVMQFGDLLTKPTETSAL